MPTDPTAAMARARANYSFLAEAKNDAHLRRLKAGVDGYNQSLHIANVIDDDQLKQLTAELDEAFALQRKRLAPG